ncbi:hypothetical protein [Brevibacillus choshinensis]|uniref:Uncharacterized protein n=1 Tax=Brevibacillus choshinensis TaxID=54911 RepID=A0ABX7FQU2_BRECH|nr:hypothetical protein [Brevibacillus choshinensis]QRG68471.1 hypothetical protein JNE38_04670 [Brevibacillus choshinensis]
MAKSYKSLCTGIGSKLTAGTTLPRFNEYEGAEMIANRSQMIILKTTDHASDLLLQTMRAEGRGRHAERGSHH